MFPQDDRSLTKCFQGQKKFNPGPIYTGDRWSRPVGWAAITFLCFGILLAMFPVGGPNPTPQGKASIENYRIQWQADHLPDMNYTVVINMAVWLGATAYYFIDARKWFKGPKVTVDLDLLTEEQEEILREEGVEVEGLEGQEIPPKEASGIQDAGKTA